MFICKKCAGPAFQPTRLELTRGSCEFCSATVLKEGWEVPDQSIKDGVFVEECINEETVVLIDPLLSIEWAKETNTYRVLLNPPPEWSPLSLYRIFEAITSVCAQARGLTPDQLLDLINQEEDKCQSSSSASSSSH